MKKNIPEDDDFINQISNLTQDLDNLEAQLTDSIPEFKDIKENANVKRDIERAITYTLENRYGSYPRTRDPEDYSKYDIKQNKRESPFRESPPRVYQDFKGNQEKESPYSEAYQGRISQASRGSEEDYNRNMEKFLCPMNN